MVSAKIYFRGDYPSRNGADVQNFIEKQLAHESGAESPRFLYNHMQKACKKLPNRRTSVVVSSEKER